jgi:hypothetical protein
MIARVRNLKARFAAIAIVGLLTLSVIAFGFSAVGEVRGGAPAVATSADQPTQDGSDNTALSTFKFVCPFH